MGNNLHERRPSDSGLGHCYWAMQRLLADSSLGMLLFLGDYTVSVVMDLMGLLFLVYSVCTSVSGSCVSATSN